MTSVQILELIRIAIKHKESKAKQLRLVSMLQLAIMSNE